MTELAAIETESDVVLFYRYMPLDDEHARTVAAEQRRLGAQLQLVGRVLVAGEGINGTVQGEGPAVLEYKTAVEEVFGTIDWKHSSGGDAKLFPDFVVKEVPELVSFGLKCSLDVQADAGISLPPADFDRLLAETPAADLRVVDVRNTFEYEVGHFAGARDPGMTHTAQWPRFVNNNLEDLRGKQVLLYCTGGIRCEKASAYLRRRLAETAGSPENGVADVDRDGTGVFMLEGGIHRYLETFTDGGHFRGANFVFDRRAQMRPQATCDREVIGECSECSNPWDVHHGGRVCCVCRALVLVCDSCDAASMHGEYWCSEHAELRGIYFHFVDSFGLDQLLIQKTGLEERIRLSAVGARGKNRRNTLRKKLQQIDGRIARLCAELEHATDADENLVVRRCRACERPYKDCPGECWGFWRRSADLQPEDAQLARE